MNSEINVVIVDYGVKNVFTLEKCLEHIGAKVTVSSYSSDIRNATHIILPGPISLKRGLDNFVDDHLDHIIIDEIKSGKPILAIAQGMEMLYDKAIDDSNFKGLRIFKGKFEKFDEDLHGLSKHVGWDKVIVKKPSRLLEGIKDLYFYFSHLYYTKSNFQVVAKANVGFNFASVVEMDNVFAVQFYPEKSGNSGVKLLENFLKV